MKTISDKIVAITGAGSGFGRALALEVALRGGIPVLLDVNGAALQETAAQVKARGGRSASHVLNICDPAQWSAVAGKVMAEFGRADVLINNAGVMSRAESFLETSEEHGRLIFDVNVWGMFHGSRAFVPLLAKQPESALVNVASSLALISSPMHAVYCASKAAIASLTAVIRQELAQTNIRVTTVYPGPSKTGLGRNVPTDDAAKREVDAKNFEKFAITSPEKVARKIINGILAGRQTVVTSADSRASQIFQRLAPGAGHALMAKVYRKVSDPKLFERLRQL